MRRLGVIGSMVWDRIYARDVREGPVDEWGGITYALGALAAARPADWRIVPLVKVGRDLDREARAFLHGLPGVEVGGGVLTVPEPNNRVELRYRDNARRVERLTGGVPAWRWDELEPRLAGLDALYINLISGFELELETAQRLRLAFPGPIYTDLHSLLLDVAPGGRRVPRGLDSWREWLRCFDIVQVNEDELGLLAGRWGDPWRFAAEIVGESVKLLLVTLGPRGAAYVASPAWDQRFAPLSRPDANAARRSTVEVPRLLGTPGPVRSERVALERDADAVDPTGCGDVWGATCCVRLLAGDDIVDAVRAANAAASRNVEHRGARGLHLYLQGRFES